MATKGEITMATKKATKKLKAAKKLPKTQTLSFVPKEFSA
jgi:hypothetical protein